PPSFPVAGVLRPRTDARVRPRRSKTYVYDRRHTSRCGPASGLDHQEPFDANETNLIHSRPDHRILRAVGTDTTPAGAHTLGRRLPRADADAARKTSDLPQRSLRAAVDGHTRALLQPLGHLVDDDVQHVVVVELEDLRG